MSPTCLLGLLKYNCGLKCIANRPPASWALFIYKWGYSPQSILPHCVRQRGFFSKSCHKRSVRRSEVDWNATKAAVTSSDEVRTTANVTDWLQLLQITAQFAHRFVFNLVGSVTRWSSAHQAEGYDDVIRCTHIPRMTFWFTGPHPTLKL